MYLTDLSSLQVGSNGTSDTNKYGYGMMHTCETLCSHIPTNPGSAESTRLVYFCTSAHHHFILYICYIMCGSTSESDSD